MLTGAENHPHRVKGKQPLSEERQFFAYFAHDVRNRLNVMALHIEEIRITLEQAGAPIDAVDKLTRTMREISDIFTNALSCIAMEHGRIVPQIKEVNFISLLFDTVPSKKARFTCHALKYIVDTDETIVRRIVANLVENAIKYNTSKDLIDITLFTVGCQIVLSVRNKCKLPDEFREHPELLFEFLKKGSEKDPFKNFGLGLAFCKSAAELLGGKIEVPKTKKDEFEIQLWLSLKS